MNGDRKIKKFDDFMKGPRLHRSLDMTIISGVIKGGFFSRDKPFELFLYHTPAKHRIFDHKLVGCTLAEINISIKVGDSVDQFRTWANINGYKVEDFTR
jgi:hypothetical protein